MNRSPSTEPIASDVEDSVAARPGDSENLRSKPHASRAPRAARRHSSWGLVALATTGVVVGLVSYGGVGKLIWGDDPAPNSVTDSSPVPDSGPANGEVAEAETETPEQRRERRRQAALGRWKTYYKGDRFMTVRPDGTATIEANLVEYTWIEKKIVGTDRVIFEIEWEIDGEDLVFDTVGGSPKASVDVITTIHGMSKRYPLVHVTETELRYRSDTPEEADYVWTRMSAE